METNRTKKFTESANLSLATTLALVALICSEVPVNLISPVVHPAHVYSTHSSALDEFSFGGANI